MELIFKFIAFPWRFIDLTSLFLCLDKRIHEVVRPSKNHTDLGLAYILVKDLLYVDPLVQIGDDSLLQRDGLSSLGGQCEIVRSALSQCSHHLHSILLQGLCVIIHLNFMMLWVLLEQL